jgi:adenosylhomocysteine nucleosidase
MTEICVIAAMNDELQVFFDDHKNEIKLIEENPFKIYQFKNHLIALSGIGLVNAGACLSYVATKFKPKSFLNIGLAGAAENADVKILEPLIVSDVYHGGVDATVFGYDFGQTPKESKVFKSDNALNTEIKNLIPAKTAVLASTDSFVNSISMFNDLIAPLKEDISIIDMEAFGYFQIAKKFNTPIASLKIVSDILNNKSDNNLQFLEILAQGSQMIAELMVKYLK